ncbi:TM2 domain-containing protein [Lactococcus nasutitermitis]|uniref:TM2 domain-containing protein n=1 Tax=Lactococcus nasutitermitis TaxID=1652957 RepID=A0ABV9JAV7_9LACT|nr:TM2 domain-containing protein [Lactococcus nasutitermitis]
MNEIINVTDEEILVGKEDGSTFKVSRSAANYENPKIGDKVKVFETEGQQVISKAQSSTEFTDNLNKVANTVNVINAKETKMNKHLFVWLGAFLFGSLGVDRFMRGQIGLGIVKILFGWLTLGIWALVDWIIALVKVYGSAYHDTEEVTFINGKYSK